MFNKIIIAALAFASTAYGIGLTNENSVSVLDHCSNLGENCYWESDCCDGLEC